jgi:hypothetical protein
MSKYICDCGAHYEYKEALENCRSMHGKPDDYRYEDSLCIDCTCYLTDRLAAVERERDEALEGWNLLVNEVSCLLVEHVEFFPLKEIKNSVLKVCLKSHDKLTALREAAGEGE